MKDSDGKWRFENTPDSDPALPANIEWANKIVERIGTSTLGIKETEEYFIDSKEKLNEVIETAYQGGLEWGKISPKERSEILHKAGVYLAAHRDELIEVAGSGWVKVWIKVTSKFLKQSTLLTTTHSWR